MIRKIFFTFLLLATTLPLPAQELELRELIRNHLRAVGKVDSFRKLTSYTIRGTLTQGDVSMPFVLYKRNGALRCEIDTNHPNGKTIILYDGRHAWQWQQLAPEKANRPSPEAVTRIAEEAQFLPILSDYQNRGYQAQFVGTTYIPESEFSVYQIKLRRSGDTEETDIYIDAHTLLEVRRDLYPTPDSSPLKTVFGDYRSIEGFQTPHLVVNYINDQKISQVVINSITLNVGIPRYFFEAPSE